MRCMASALSQVPRREVKDVYTRIPHALKPLVPSNVIARLHQFYKETFWSNFKVFRCCQAAQATRRIACFFDLAMKVSRGQVLYLSQNTGNFIAYMFPCLRVSFGMLMMWMPGLSKTWVQCCPHLHRAISRRCWAVPLFRALAGRALFA